MYENIDYDKLRSDLMDYFGSAMAYYPAAVIELSEVENASNDKLIQIAIQNGFNLNDYENSKTKKY